MKRLLCIVGMMNAAGAETVLMKLYRHLDKTKYQMDFCLGVKEKCYYDDEIMSMGGRIFHITPKSENVKEFKKQLFEVISREKYEYILRITSSGMGFWDLKIAKKAGARVCAARSSNANGLGLKKYVAHHLGKLLYGKYVDIKLAPSDLAAIYAFGKKAYKNGEVHILRNAVDLNIFRFDDDGRQRIRHEFNIDDNVKLYGHIGRLERQKNHTFLLDVFSHIHKKDSSAMLMLVGIGMLENEIKAKIDELGLRENVIFTGVRSDIPQILCAMDAFVFPSLYEGMPNTVVEAQACGLPCLIADTITKEADITGIVKYLPLNSPEKWADLAMEMSNMGHLDTEESFRKEGYCIEDTVQQFAHIIMEN